MRFKKLQTMMPNMGPNVASPMGMGVPKMPAMPAAMPRPPVVSASPVTRTTLPSIQATANAATPIELGDPKRLAKIGTLLRLGRK